jgi:hypothetical protein
MPDIEDEDVTPTPEEAPLRPAKVGVKDAGEIVGTAFGQKVDGRIADIADGD